VVLEQSLRVLRSYEADGGLVEEHANNERRIAQGGYGDRQIFELVQNSADELRDRTGGEIAVVLTEKFLYCANEGNPVTAEGIDTILRMSTSKKRGGQIGRFGVGIKSVLAISDAPEFFSTYRGELFGFGFDREWSARQVRSVVHGARDTPVLRMARLLDVAGSRSTDPVLDDLLRWATTVVRLPLVAGVAGRLAIDLHKFPVEFPLFSSHVGTITLVDRRGRPQQRQIDHRSSGNKHFIQESRLDGSVVEHEWRVFTVTHRPSRTALGSAGELHDRPEIDISWAVPRSSGARGLFWSYFPTKFATTLRGLLNAPWKTSEDRQAIFDGNAFNEELISIAARLVVDSLPALVDAKDPAAYIDFLPGRGREAPQFADERLTRAIWAAAAERPSLVDQDGVLRRPSEMQIHPEDLREDWLREWAACPDRPVDWVHHRADTRERRGRVKIVLAQAGRKDASSVVEWLEALVGPCSPRTCAAALRIASEMSVAGHPLADQARSARILLTESGQLVSPQPGSVFRRAGDTLADGLTYVDERVVAEFGGAGALDVLGVREADAAGRFAAVVDQGLEGYDDARWTAFWEMSRTAGTTAVLEALRTRPKSFRTALRVRTVAGVFCLPEHCLLPGPVVPADGSRDAEIAVDMRFHTADLTVLRALGLLDKPVLERAPQEDDWFDDYCDHYHRLYLKRLDEGDPRPLRKFMRFDGPPPPGPLGIFRALSEEGRAAFVGALPAATSAASWTMQVGKQQQTRQQILSPLGWMIRSIGVVATSRGLRRVVRSVGPALKEYSHLLPVVAVGQGVAAALRLPDSLDAVRPVVWADLVEEASQSTDDAFPGAVYALLFRADAEWPEGAATRCRVGDEWVCDRPDTEIAVTASPTVYRDLRRERIPALLVPAEDDAATMIEQWQMLAPEQVISRELRHVAEAPGLPLGELFPALRMRHRQSVDGILVVRCTELEEITRTPNGITAAPRRHAVEDRALLVLRPDDDEALLVAVDEALRLGLGPGGRRSVLDQKHQQAANERKRAIRMAESPAEKVLKMVGEDQLRAGLPRGLEEAERRKSGHTPTGLRIAELALDTHGGAVLRHHAKDIAQQDETSPRTFNGSTGARRHVAELGLPEEFAGASVVHPPEMEEVDGPTDLPALHDYQERVAARMVEHLLAPEPARAMLSLPTGAGKTRVAVEAVTRFVRERGTPTGPVLWIAQSEELCEQAVQSWRFVWGKAGPAGRLVINRFWGGNDAAPVTDTTQLVVATDATLNSRLGKIDHGWLRAASVVIVDEAHRAVSTSYTQILSHLGIERSRTARPLIGLSATPFRGRSEQQTSWLVNRFGARRLDIGIFEEGREYETLQNLGVLARIEHRVLKGATIQLDERELTSATQFSTLPSSAEDELAQDVQRNDTLLDAITGLPEEWSVLVFAASVEHAKLLTALLNQRGRPATSIDGYTPVGERRTKIEGYRAGRYRTIVNYNVLAQGFDAPRTNAVVIARPTFSPNVYQQMIGRGLRGPRNGGNESCTILDVRDNVQNYRGELAFTEFEYLWRKQ
jgi:superfamily II DNA or RNA helicase